MMETMWFYASLFEQREFIMVLIVHACVFFIFFSLALFLSLNPTFLYVFLLSGFSTLLSRQTR